MNERFPFLIDIKEFARAEAENARDKHCGKLLNHRVGCLDHGFVGAARRCQAVFDVGQVRLQAQKIVACLEIRLRQRKKLAQYARECCFGRGASCYALRSGRGISSLHDSFQRPALVGCIALYRFDQIGNEILPTLQLHIDIGEGLVALLPHGDETVVGSGAPNCAHDDKEQNDPCKKLPLVCS